jgi:hypothetical protein
MTILDLNSLKPRPIWGRRIIIGILAGAGGNVANAMTDLVAELGWPLPWKILLGVGVVLLLALGYKGLSGERRG